MTLEIITLPGEMLKFKPNIRSRFIVPILTISCFTILILNLIVLKSHQPVGYVFNIYSLLPISFIIGSILCYFICSILLVKYGQKISLFALIILEITILMIPFSFGYYSMGRADEMTYLGGYTSVINSASFGDVIYPASYILGSTLTLIMNIPTNYVAFLIQIFFSLVFVVGMIVFMKKITDNEIIYHISILSAFFFYFSHYHHSIAPNYIFFTILPLYFYAGISYFKNRTVSTSAVLLVFTLLMPFTHPFVYFFIASVLLVSMISSVIFKYEVTFKQFFLLLNITFFIWFMNTARLMKTTRQLYILDLEGTGRQPIIVSSVSKIQSVDFDYLSFIKYINVFFGRYYIPTVFIILAIVYIYLLCRNKNTFTIDFKKKYAYIIYIYFGIFLFQVFLLINSFIVHQPDRIVNLFYGVFAQIPLFAYSLSALFLNRSENKLKNRNIIMICFILTGVWTLSMFGLFNSPYIYRPSEALTYNEVIGMKHFYEIKSDDGLTMLMEQNRYRDLFSEPRSESFYYTEDHLGYNSSNQNDTFASININDNQSIYVVLTTLNEYMYQVVPGYNKIDRYNSQDFVRFRNDLSIYHIYDSLNLEIYKTTNNTRGI